MKIARSKSSEAEKRSAAWERNHRLMYAAVCALLCGLSGSGTALAQTDWTQKVFFENSISPRAYFYSDARVSAPSTLELVGKLLPVDTTNFVSGPNSLKLHWQSAPGGGWDASVLLPNWPNRFIDYSGDTLYVWLYSATALRASEMPKIGFRDTTNGFTERLPLGEFARDLPASKWTRVAIPLVRFASISVRPFQTRHLNTILLLQGGADGTPHTLLIDDIRIEDARAQNHSAPAAPMDLVAKGFERHVQLSWKPVPGNSVAQYVIYRSMDGGPYQAIGVQTPDTHRYMDFIGKPGIQVSYKVSGRTSALRESPMSNVATASTHAMSDDELLTMVQEASFQYYWDGAEPNSGMGRESIPGNPDLIAVGGSGFGIMSLIVGAERGFAPREEIVQRMLRITHFLAHADRYHGAWPHFLSGSTGKMLPNFGEYDNGADLVETSFLTEGLLAARGYFTHDTPEEHQLREEITELWKGVEWDWFRATPARDALYWHWSPDFAFHIANRLKGWSEVMITYMLAIASPTHPVPSSLYYTGWASEGDPVRKFGEVHSYYGIPVWMNSSGSPGPLFFTHYSFMGYDPRGMHDKFADYFDNNRNTSLVQQKYAIENPLHFKDYGADSWGMSAVTGPHGYREYKPFTQDDGTLAPTAAMGAYAYTPGPSLAALKHFYRDLGSELWDVYGFRNAFNVTEDWYSPDELALNQGPQTVMIENGRTGLVWRSFMSNPEIPAMQKAIGFVGDAK